MWATSKHHGCPRESRRRGPGTSHKKKKKKEKMYFNVDNFVSFCPAIKQGQKSTANNEIFPTVGRNTGENNFYYNIALFCCWESGGHPGLCLWLDLNTRAEDILLPQPPAQLELHLCMATPSSIQYFPHEMRTTGQAFPFTSRFGIGKHSQSRGKHRKQRERRGTFTSSLSPK